MQTPDPTPHVLRISLLGHVRVERIDGAPAGDDIIQPRRLALLAFLALRQTSVRRSEIIALFWPDRDEQRARASLSQLIHSIHKAVDARIIESAPDDALMLSAVSCDVQAFMRLVDLERYADAADTWQGDLMPGFGATLPREFNDWIDARRLEYRRLFADVAWRATSHAPPSRALPWLDRAASIAPFDERLLRRRLELLAADGNLGAAADAYESFRVRLRAELDITPSAETVRLMHNIAERTAAADPSLPPLAAHSAGRGLPMRRPARRVAAWGTAAAVLTFAAWSGSLLQRGAEASPPEIRLRVVDADTADVAATAVADLVGRELATLLFPFSIAAADERADFIVQLDLPATDAAERTGLVRIVDAQGAVLRTTSFDVPTGSAPARLATAVVRRVIPELSGAVDMPDERRALLDAEALIRDAQDHARSGAFENSERNLLAAEHILRAGESRGLPGLLAARIAEQRGWNAMATRDMPSAAQHFERAARLIAASAVESADALERLGSINFMRWTVSGDDPVALLDTATVQLARSVSIEPARASAWLQLSRVQFANGKFDESLGAARRASRLGGGATISLGVVVQLFTAAFHARYDTYAADDCTRIRTLAPHQWQAIACAALLAGWSEEGRYELGDLLEEVDQLEEPAPVRDVMVPRMHALIRAAAARRDIALALHQPIEPRGEDLDGLLYRLSESISRGAIDTASLRNRLLATTAGQRVLRLNSRLVESR